MAIAILIERRKHPAQRGPRHRWRHQRAESLHIQLSAALQSPKHLLQIDNVLLLQMRHAGQTLEERRRLQLGAQLGDAGLEQQPLREHGGALVGADPRPKLLVRDAIGAAEQREQCAGVRERRRRCCRRRRRWHGHVGRRGQSGSGAEKQRRLGGRLVGGLDLQGFGKVRLEDVRARLIAVDVPEESAA